MEQQAITRHEAACLEIAAYKKKFIQNEPAAPSTEPLPTLPPVDQSPAQKLERYKAACLEIEAYKKNFLKAGAESSVPDSAVALDEANPTCPLEAHENDLQLAPSTEDVELRVPHAKAALGRCRSFSCHFWSDDDRRESVPSIYNFLEY